MRASSGAVTVELAESAAGATIAVTGDLDIASAPALVEMAERAVTIEGSDMLVLDLGGVRFCDSAGIHALIAARELCAQHGRRLQTQHSQPAVKRVLELTGLIEYLDVT